MNQQSHFFIMRLTWWIYRAMARMVLSPQELKAYPVDMSTPDERLFMIDEIMQDHPGHWVQIM